MGAAQLVEQRRGGRARSGGRGNGNEAGARGHRRTAAARGAVERGGFSPAFWRSSGEVTSGRSASPDLVGSKRTCSLPSRMRSKMRGIAMPSSCAARATGNQPSASERDAASPGASAGTAAAPVDPVGWGASGFSFGGFKRCTRRFVPRREDAARGARV